MPAILDEVTVDQLRAKLLTLSEADRRSLYDALAESLGMEWVEEWPPEMLAELERRIQDIESGKAKAIPFEQVMDEWKAKYGNESNKE
jgi:putative addiction module component (TIGR02574 family)